MTLMKKAGRITMSWIGRLKKILKTEHHTSQQSLSPPQESPVAPNSDDEIPITMDDQIEIALLQTREDVSNSRGSFMNIDIDTHATTAGSAAPPPPHPVSVVFLERDDQLPLFSSIVHRAIDLPTAISTYTPATNTGASPAAADPASVVWTNSLNSLITMIREAEIGKVCLAIDVSSIIAWITIQANWDKVNHALLDWVLVGFVISSGSIVVGIVIRKYKPQAANVTEQFGICLTFISFLTFPSLYLKSKVALVLVMTTGVIVVLVLAVPVFLPVTADEGESDNPRN